MNILISGATRGIGKAIAEKLASKNHKLHLIARNISDLESLKAKLDNETVQHKTFSFDLSDIDTVNKELIELIEVDQFDVIVNNLGIFETNPADQIEIEALKKLMDLNLYSAINLTNLFISQLKKKEQGTIINIGSVMSHLAAPFAANYSITKHAFKGWNDSLREELRQSGIKVCAILPGAVNTSSWDGIEVNRDSMIQPEDIAELVETVLSMNYNTMVDEIKVSPLKF